MERTARCAATERFTDEPLNWSLREKPFFQNDFSILVNPLATALHECHCDWLVNKLLLAYETHALTNCTALNIGHAWIK